MNLFLCAELRTSGSGDKTGGSISVFFLFQSFKKQNFSP